MPLIMELLRDFKKLGKDDAYLAGGKGASLGEMTQAGISVPPGFVILSASFERFLEETDLNVEIDAILTSVDHKAIQTIDNASEKIKALILQAKMPVDIAEEIKKSFKNLGAKYVAVRSSATAEDGADHAWAGQLESFLNTTEDDLLDKVKHCWASLFTPRAIFYRFEKDLHKQKISVAVVVQKMVESEKSGIAFSVHPVTEDRNQLIIEAGFGLGEAIVSGSITPDSYVVEKEPRRIINTNVSNQTRGLYRSENGGNEWRELGVEGEKKVLDEKQILELSELILKIENHYGFPCDIEWAFEKGKFYIVQSRPITTLTQEITNQYPRGVDWSSYLEREQSIFLDSLFIRPYSVLAKEVTGFSFNHQLYIYENGITTILLSQSELKAAKKHFLVQIQNNKETILSWMERGHTQNKWADTILETFRKGQQETVQFDEIIANFEQELLYSTLVPFWILMSVENAFDKTGVADVIEKAEALRNESRYPNLVDTVISFYWDKASKLTSQPRTVVELLTVSELTELFAGKQLNFEEIHQRAKCMFWRGDENVTVFSYDTGLREELKPKLDLDTTVIKGSAANKGFVRGTVRIVNLPKDISKVHDGDILVSINTNPSLMPALLKAAAIVSDEGGMGCHAAIVARELGKPGVVGTKIATKVLKDGDEVEVDANQGVIRILK